MDDQMDFETRPWRLPPESGGVRLTRLIAKVGEHTHMYVFPDEEFDDACEIITRHVESGQLHPYAGIVLLEMIGEMI